MYTSSLKIGNNKNSQLLCIIKFSFLNKKRIILVYAILISHFKCYLSYEKHCIKLKKGEVNVAKVNNKKSKDDSHKIRPALTPEARENQLIYLATDLAEQQLRDGTASSQVITHYLKLGTTKERIEKEILEKQKELISAKTESIKSAKRIEELYANAISAMRKYSGHIEEDEEDDY